MRARTAATANPAAGCTGSARLLRQRTIGARRDRRGVTWLQRPIGTGRLRRGHPGVRPLTALAVTRQLNQHGIHVRAGRTAALVDLAGQLPPAVLASLISLHPATADRWSRPSPAIGPPTSTPVPSAKRRPGRCRAAG